MDTVGNQRLNKRLSGFDQSPTLLDESSHDKSSSLVVSNRNARLALLASCLYSKYICYIRRTTWSSMVWTLDTTGTYSEFHFRSIGGYEIATVVRNHAASAGLREIVRSCRPLRANLGLTISKTPRVQNGVVPLRCRKHYSKRSRR